MRPLQRYLAEEIATDHADGFLSRREAMHRLSLLGLGIPAATALLAACGAPEQEAAPPATPSRPQETGPAPPPTEEITFGDELRGAWAQAEDARGAVLVIHENRGLNDHIREVAGRLAGEGYSALALDLLSHEGGTAAVGDEAAAMAALNEIEPAQFTSDMKAALSELESREPGKKLGVVGFCFGGGMAWLLLSSREPRLAAAVPFYGPLPDDADFSGTNAAVLGIYAAQDDRVNATREDARTALEEAGLEHDIVTFDGADHAFFNDTGPRYNAEAAGRAWQRVLSWFGEHLG